MIKMGEAYAAAITGDTRRVLLKAVVNIIDPDMAFSGVEHAEETWWAKPEQVSDKVFDRDEYVTLERGRWRLNRTTPLLPDGAVRGEMGYVSAAVSGEDGTFAREPWVEQRFVGVSILQACSVYFPTAAEDGIPVDFRVEIVQNGVVYHTETFENNGADHVSVTGFTVYEPDAIRVTVSRWSLPGRRMRCVEIIPGVYEEWGNRMLASFQVVQQANFSCLSLPYGTCTLRMDNKDRRFEPRNKNGVFQSIQERQRIDVRIGVRLPEGEESYVNTGVFYQAGGGWRTGDNGLTLQWDLVDIVGLIAGREFIVPEVLPTTLGGWIAALVGQLGANFADCWRVDPDYAGLAVTAGTEDVTGRSCGDILRWVCMATGTWPRADSETGDLTVEPYWHEGNKVTLDNLTAYPVMKANEELAAIIFTLNDTARTKVVVSGNSTSANQTVSVVNPFLTTREQALTAARLILATYGGNKLELTGRGDPAGEIGDVDTVWLNESTATTARRQKQVFRIQNGVLQNCQSVLLQADGAFLFEQRVVLTQSGSWTAPAGVTQLRYILVGPGEDGGDGEDGTYRRAGEDGADGLGGKVLAGTMGVNEGQVFRVSILDTGTEFGSLSSAEGSRYPYGYTDIASGDSFGRSGVKKPQDGSGDGGRGGSGGAKGNKHEELVYENTPVGNLPAGYREVIDNKPGKGKAGSKGALGCVVLWYDREEADSV